MLTGRPGVAGQGVAVRLHQPGGGPDAVAFGPVFEDGDGLLLGQLGTKQGSPFSFGGPSLAGAAIEHPTPLIPAVTGADRQVVDPSAAVVGASLVQATGAREVLHHDDASSWRTRVPAQ